jgi:hypothetical protein
MDKIKVGQTMYRYTTEYIGDEEYTGKAEPWLDTCRVVRLTNQGCWVQLRMGLGMKDKWVSLSSRKRFCYPTKVQAMRAYIARRYRFLAISKSNVDYAESSIVEAKKQLEQMESK